MEDLQTDTLSDYGKNPNTENADLESVNKDNDNAVNNLLNGCDDIDDPLDLMDNCDNASIGSNSDIWKGSDSEDECFDGRNEDLGTDKNMSSDIQSVPTEKVEGGEDKHEEPELSKEDQNEASTEEKLEENDKNTAAEENNEDTSVIESEELTAAIEVEVDGDKKEEEPPDNKERSGDKEENKDDGKEEEIEKVVAGEASDEKEATEKVNDLPEEKATDKQQVIEKDPLAINDDEPVQNDVIEKDPLALDSPEKDSSENKNKNQNDEGQEDEDCQMDYDDDDFDPSLLCPEVSMAVDESPVITTNGPMPGDGSASPLPYEPVFSTFVDEVTGAEISFNLTAEELELRKRLYGPTNPIQISRIHCTACNVHLGSALEGQSNRFVHPLLKVLICKECYHFYTSGEFEKDEDGSELYCRWCGQGGQVLCCSKCEFVFCKRCIRTNFGRQKMVEIRDSDNWDCFRCNPSQIITQRVACYEFFEYVRREMARTSTLTFKSDIWSKDYSRCCAARKRAAEPGAAAEEPRKPKRKRGEMDPDYTPMNDIAPKLEKSTVMASPSTLSGGTCTPAPNSAMGRFQKFPAVAGRPSLAVPKPVTYMSRCPKPKDNDIEFVRHIPAPQVALNPVRSSMSTYRTILPNTARPMMQPPTLVRINQSLPPSVGTSGSRLLSSSLQGRSLSTSQNIMKHEWFEKTVRAAARVNSHLSYTLTQLNKAQSQAASVEELAVVHNKLQEILSSSINSLIQIRKNLRTEFIAGIKTVRLPSKKVAESFSNDDDVIFVSAPPAAPKATPSTSQATPSTSQAKVAVPDPVVIIDKSTTAPPRVEEKGGEGADKPKGYLKVKSVMELQNVPSECITIPDDPAPPVLTKEVESEDEGKKKEEDVKDVEEKKGQDEKKVEEKKKENEMNVEEKKKKNEKNVEEKTMENEKNVEEKKKEKEEEKKDEGKESSSEEVVCNGVVKNEEEKSKTPEPKKDLKEQFSESASPSKKLSRIEIDLTEEAILETRTRRSKENHLNKIVYNVKDKPSAEIKKMLSVTVNLPRVDLEKLQKQLPNGCN